MALPVATALASLVIRNVALQYCEAFFVLVQYNTDCVADVSEKAHD